MANSKERRKARRDKKFRGIESKVSDAPGIKPSHTPEEMNDLCPKFYTECGHPNKTYEWNCFGKYENCKYLK